QPLGLVAADVPTLPAHQRMHLPAPVGAEVFRMQPGDLRHEEVVPQPTRRRRTTDGGAIPASGEEPLNCRSEDTADELDPETVPVLGDGPDHLGQGRSSSFAKNTLAALSISFAFRSPAFSFCSRLISAAASVVSPGFTPASTS